MTLAAEEVNQIQDQDRNLDQRELITEKTLKEIEIGQDLLEIEIVESLRNIIDILDLELQMKEIIEEEETVEFNLEEIVTKIEREVTEEVIVKETIEREISLDLQIVEMLLARK